MFTKIISQSAQKDPLNVHRIYGNGFWISCVHHNTSERYPLQIVQMFKSNAPYISGGSIIYPFVYPMYIHETYNFVYPYHRTFSTSYVHLKNIYCTLYICIRYIHCASTVDIHFRIQKNVYIVHHICICAMYVSVSTYI